MLTTFRQHIVFLFSLVEPTVNDSSWCKTCNQRNLRSKNWTIVSVPSWISDGSSQTTPESYGACITQMHVKWPTNRLWGAVTQTFYQLHVNTTFQRQKIPLGHFPTYTSINSLMKSVRVWRIPCLSRWKSPTKNLFCWRGSWSDQLLHCL